MAIVSANGAATPLSPNYIINGAFDFFQRGTSINAGVFTYVSDRWATVANHSGGTVNYSRQTFTPGSSPISGVSNYIRMTATSPTGGTVNTLYQRIEDVNTLAGQVATFSFWAKASTATSVSLNPFQDTGTGGSGQYSAGAAVVSVTTSWQRFTHTYAVPSVSGKTIGTGSFLAVEFMFPANTSLTVEIAGAQLEAGSIATPFRRNANSIQGELAACQRYYQRFGTERASGQFFTSTNARIHLPLLVTMRVNPSITISTPYTVDAIGNGASTTTNAPSPYAPNGDLIRFDLSGLSPSRSYYQHAVWIGGAIEASAEL